MRLHPLEKAFKALEDVKRIRFGDPNFRGLMQSQRVVDGLAEHKKNKSHWHNELSALAAAWSLVFTLCLLTVQEKPQTCQLMAQTSMAIGDRRHCPMVPQQDHLPIRTTAPKAGRA